MIENSFYKYYSINQNLYSSIINNELYFSNPREFNDPFDSYPRFKLTHDKEKLKLFYEFLNKQISGLETFILESKINLKKYKEYKDLLQVYFSGHLFEEDLYANEIENKNEKLIELYTFYVDRSNYEKLLNHNIEFLQIKMYYDFIFLTIDNQNFGVSCGSTNPRCPLMWGHYANNHKGVCIKYEFGNKEIQNISLDKKVKLEVLKVKYSDMPIDIFNYSSKELKNLKFEILSNKYSKWNYENEIRLVNQGKGLLKIKRSSIKEVIFGCKSTPKERYSIIKLLASLGYKVDRLLIAKRLPDQYELLIQEMKINDIAGSGVYLEEINL